MRLFIHTERCTYDLGYYKFKINYHATTTSIVCFCTYYEPGVIYWCKAMPKKGCTLLKPLR